MEESPGKMYALATVMSVIALVPALLRFYVRTPKQQSLGIDDWLIIPALVGCFGTAAAMYVATIKGGLGLHTPIGPDGNAEYTDSTVIFLKANFATLFTQILTFSCTKLSVLFFYRRLFRGKTFNAVSWILIVLTLMWTITYLIGHLFQCASIESNWAGNGLSSSCVDELLLYGSESWLDVLLDLNILAVPLPIIWKLQMSYARRLQLSLVFLLGALVVLAGIARLIAYINVADNMNTAGEADITWTIAPTFYWPLIESSLGILGACLPSLQPIFKGFSVEGLVAHMRAVLSLSPRGSRPSKNDKELPRNISPEECKGFSSDVVITVVGPTEEQTRYNNLRSMLGARNHCHVNGIHVETTYQVE